MSTPKTLTWVATWVMTYLVTLASPSAYIYGQALTVDLLEEPVAPQNLTRVFGSQGTGRFGVPVSGPYDVDGDGFQDFAVGYMTASPLGRSLAGEVDLIFGNGSLGDTFDTGQTLPNQLRIFGDVLRETAGSEIWMDDVTGDGLGDLLIGRQNFSPSGDRIGAGALTILVGGPRLRQLAQTDTPIDLQNPPDNLTLFTLVGREQFGRLGIWFRTGDVDGDEIPDLVVGADQEDQPTAQNAGAVYVIRGGPHLAQSMQLDLSLGLGSLDGNLIRFAPPEGSSGFHVGATCQIGDLDGNNRGEVIVAATLNRAGASLNPEGAPPGAARGSGGISRGAIYILWDDLFPQTAWPEELPLQPSPIEPSGFTNRTFLRGGLNNRIFGEEIIAGGDFDANGEPDLFVGDFTGSAPMRSFAGLGFVFFDAAELRGVETDMDNLPDSTLEKMTTILGPSSGSIASDTAALGDFNGDGIDDLAVGAPHANPIARRSAGAVHFLFGQNRRWPTQIDTAFGRLPDSRDIQITELFGANGSTGSDSGDTLCYSASAGDVDGDGKDELITNEMVGNGPSPESIDVGNLIVVSGSRISTLFEDLVAQLAGGAGLISEVFLLNPSETLSARARLQTVLPLNDSQDTSSATTALPEIVVDVPPLSVRVLKTDEEGPILANGLKLLSNIKLGVQVRFQLPVSGAASVGPSPRFRAAAGPAFWNTSRRTGLALFNPLDETVELELQLFQNGTEFSPTVTVDLAPNGHLSTFLDVLFSTHEAPFAGVVTIRAVSGLFAGTLLELGSQTGQLTTLTLVRIQELQPEF